MVDLLITSTYKEKLSRTNTFCYSTILWKIFDLGSEVFHTSYECCQLTVCSIHFKRNVQLEP